MKILIVDDEVKARKGLVSSIDWCTLGIQTVVEAGDGQEALEIAFWLEPDIILSDIKMPKMDGINFAYQFANRYPEAKILFMSSYMEIEYLQSAIKLAAVDYISKPIKPVDIENGIRKAVEQLRHNRSINLHIKQGRAIKEQMYAVMLTYEKVKNQNEESLQHEIGINTVGNGFYCCVIEADNDDVLNYIPLIGKKYGFFAIGGMRKQDYYVAILEEQEKNAKTDLFCKAMLQQDYVKFIAASTLVKTIDEIPTAYEMAAQLIEHRFFSEMGSYAKSSGKLTYEVPELGVIHLFEKYIDNYSNKAQELLLELYSKFTTGIYNPQQIKFLYYALLKKIYDQYPACVETTKMDQDDFLWDMINNTKNICDLQCVVITAMKKYYEFFQETESKPITAALLYMHRNYHNSALGIQDIAESVHLSAKHLNRMFSNETGKPIKQHLLEIRLEHAKSLLEDGNCKIKEVASSCGFEDSGYFAKFFRKETGFSPIEYRNQYLES